MSRAQGQVCELLLQEIQEPRLQPVQDGEQPAEHEQDALRDHPGSAVGKNFSGPDFGILVRIDRLGFGGWWCRKQTIPATDETGFSGP